MTRTQNGHRTDIVKHEQFVRHLRDALHHLWDFDYLRQSPLLSLLNLTGRFDAATALQEILTNAIQSLKPDDRESPHSPSWRIYDLLFYRYVQQFTPQEVANQLGTGERHLRRVQQLALDVLGQRLWRQFDLSRQPPTQANQEPEHLSAMETELAWLRTAEPDSSADLTETLSTILMMTKPLAERYSVTIDVKNGRAIPKVAVHPQALSQALLNILNVAIHLSARNRVTIATSLHRYEIEITVRGQGTMSGSAIVRGDDVALLDIAQRLAQMSGGRLSSGVDEGIFWASLTLPAVEQLPVIVLDDNPDTVSLLQRYAAGTRYRLFGTTDAKDLLALAEEVSPRVIVLDVMMPKIDGWQILSQVQHYPTTEHIPIVVCSILAQEELALALGARAFVRKPVRRQAFLAALDQAVLEAPDRG